MAPVQVNTKLKILLVRPDAIGDVVLMIPLINTIKKTWPKAQVYLLLQPYTQALLADHPQVSGLILDWHKQNKIQSLRDFMTYSKYLASLKFDLVIFPYLDLFYASLMWLARIPVRLGDAQKILLRPFLTHPIKQNFRNLLKHEVEQNLDLFVKYQVKQRQSVQVSQVMDLHFLPKADLELEQALAEYHLLPTTKLIGIHPASGGGNRAWLPAAYASLIDLIQAEPAYRVVLTGSGARDQAIVAEILRHTKTKPLNFAGQTTLPQLAALIKKCQVFIGTDTGPTHMAAALKTPVLCISPTKFVKALRWGPWQTQCLIIGRPDLCSVLCRPYRCRDQTCLTALTPSMVYQAYLQFLSQLSDQKETIISFDEAINKANVQKQWFLSSINFAFYLNTSNTEYLEQVLEQAKALQKLGGRVYLLCPNKSMQVSIQNLLAECPITVCSGSLFAPYQICRLIAERDINLIVLAKPKAVLIWRMIIRQITALFMYVPPVILPFERLKNDNSAEAVFALYLAAYKAACTEKKGNMGLVRNTRKD